MGWGATVEPAGAGARAVLLGLAGLSAAAVLAALAFQYLGGLQPCVLCHWQRVPHLVVVAFGLAGLVVPARTRAWLLALCAAAFLAGAGIAFFHVGVEQHWWAGTAACEGALPAATTVAELKE